MPGAPASGRNLFKIRGKAFSTILRRIPGVGSTIIFNTNDKIDENDDQTRGMYPQTRRELVFVLSNSPDYYYSIEYTYPNPLYGLTFLNQVLMSVTIGTYEKRV